MKKLLLAIPVLIDNNKRLTECLKAAFNQTMVKDGDADVYVIINNPNDESLIDQIDQFDDGYLIVNDDNFGVSGSWNQAIIEGYKNCYDYVCCMGFDTVLKDPNMLYEAWFEMENTGSDFGRGTHFSFNFWIVHTKKFLMKVGTFDENFYPAYWEDIDMMRRLRILRDEGLVNTCKFEDADKVEHSQSRTVNDHQSIIPHDVWNYTYTHNQLYMRNKWGTDEDNHKVGFKTPYNDPKLHTSFWVIYKDRYLKNKQRWDKCLGRYINE